MAHSKLHMAKILTITITITMVTLSHCVIGSKLLRTGMSHIFLSDSYYRHIIGT